MVLGKDKDAAVHILTHLEIQEFQQIIAIRHPALGQEGVWSVMDGSKLMLEQAGGGEVVQNKFYNGWKCDHYVLAMFVFTPNGRIPICCYNVPGCMHNSSIATWGGIYPKLQDAYNLAGGKWAVDSAFTSRNSKHKNYLVGSGKADAETNTPLQLTINREATSLRQAAEWGMQSFQCSFPWIKNRVVYEELGERRIIMCMLILLRSVRATRVGTNQIRTTYIHVLHQDANAEFVVPLLA